MRWTLRARLTLWHAVVIAAIVAGAALVADQALSRALGRQVDAALLALAETEAASALDSPDDSVHLHVFGRETGTTGVRRLDKLVQIVDAEGHVVDRSVTLGAARLPAPPSLLARLRLGETVVETVGDLGGGPVRLVSLPIEVDGAFRYAIQVGTLLHPVQAFLHTARLLFLAVSAAVLGAVVVIGVLLTGGALRPIERLVATARRIGEANLGERLPHPGTDDEIGRLAATLNEMLERIQRSVEVQRRFTADASHELRSPLSRLRTELEVALRRPRTAPEYEAALRSCLEEVERLGALAADLLTLARLDAGEAPGGPASLPAVVTDVLGRFESEAVHRGVTIVPEACPAVSVGLSRQDLALVVGNLVDNALKFSPPGGRVIVRASADGADAVLSVSDSGPGIPADELPRVFERFFRGRSRPPDAPGVGLGLAICRAVVEACGGRISVDSPPGAGTTFSVRLPITAAS